MTEHGVPPVPMSRPVRFVCPSCRRDLQADGPTWTCRVCHAEYPVRHGIPVFLPGGEQVWQPLVARLDREMRRHPWVIAKMSLATLTWLPHARAQILRSVPLHDGDVVLDHCTGRGDNLHVLRRTVGATGQVFAFDLSVYGLERAAASVRRRGWENVYLQQADAHALPYPNGTFDVVVHFGAWNQLAHPERALQEILRITRPGGWVVVLDEGLEPRRRHTAWGRLLRWGNPLFGAHPPVELISRCAVPEVRWVVRGLFYELRFQVPG